jgi:hypothetical protein
MNEKPIEFFKKIIQLKNCPNCNKSLVFSEDINIEYSSYRAIACESSIDKKIEDVCFLATIKYSYYGKETELCVRRRILDKLLIHTLVSNEDNSNIHIRIGGRSCYIKPNIPFFKICKNKILHLKENINKEVILTYTYSETIGPFVSSKIEDKLFIKEEDLHFEVDYQINKENILK